MITYLFPSAGHILCEALALAALPPQVTVNHTHYLVRLNGTVHHIRRDRVCTCGGTPKQPCPANPLVQQYLAAGGPRPPGRHEDTWPQSWPTVPPLCPICDCPTIADRYLDSSHGPGWRCTLDATHYWQVRLNPLRRHLADGPPPPSHPWYDTPLADRQAWIEAHSHPPRCLANPSTLEVNR